MIPKIIHYIWLGDEELSSQIKDCVESWKSVMPDYQIIQWGKTIADKINMPFVNEALQYGKWAFASDVIRLWVMYHYGGLYFDTDVKVLKSFDPLLDNHAFIGREGCLQIQGKSTSYHLTSFCFGAEKGNPYIKKCLEYYEGRHFITSSNNSLPMALRMDVRNASYIYCEIAKLFGYNANALAPSIQSCHENVLNIYSPSVLSDYCHHLSLGSWRDTKVQEEHYTLAYKIRWRIRSVLEKILKKYNFVMVKLR